MLTEDQVAALRAPFPPEEVHWRAGATNKEGNKALALAYIDARAVMDRLDEVVGPMNWQDTFEEWKDGAVKAGIGVRNDSEWVWKFDGADDTNFEATKGGFSDAFKRAAVKWGIGRYLYQLPGVWVACQKTGKTVKLLETPSLPDWALPGGLRTSEAASSDQEDISSPEDSQEAPEEHVEEVPTTEASAPAFWRLANEALELGIPHERIRHMAQSANGGGWEEAMALLKAEMVKAE